MEACHSPEISNITSYAVTFVGIVTLEAFAGMWINAFIVSVICMSWVRKKNLNSYEKILLAVGCSRFWYLCILWVYSFLLIIYPNYLHGHPTFQLLSSAQSFFTCSNFWVSACLCVFYCLKIATFRNNFFNYLKVKIDRMVPWLLLGSVLFSLVTGILVYGFTNKLHCTNSTRQAHFLKVNIKIDEQFFTFFFITGFGYTTSFTVVISSALLLLFSLWRHRCNMQTTSLKDLSMDAHIKAMKCILSFSIMYSVNFICLVVGTIYFTKEENHVMFLIYVFMYAFPGVHSLILIFSNPSLETTLLRILPCVKCKVCMK